MDSGGLEELVVPGPGDVVIVCEKDPQDRAWIWVSIHMSSRVIAGLHPAS